MTRHPVRSTLTATLFPYSTLCRSRDADAVAMLLVTGLVMQRIGRLPVDLVRLQVLGSKRRAMHDVAEILGRLAGHQLVDNEVAVDRIGDGLADPYVIQRRLLGIEGEPIDRTDALVALFGDLHFLHLLVALDQPYATQIGQHVDLMPLEAVHQAVFFGARTSVLAGKRVSVS